MRKLSVGIVGAGEIARKVHIPVLKNIPGISLDWIYDRDTDRCRSVAQAFEIATASTPSPHGLPACDVALVAIPVAVRSEYMAEFSSRGTAVLCEKPFAISELEHRRLVDLYPAHKLACGYMRRFYGSTQVLKNLCDNGWLGPLKRLAIREGNRTQGSTIAASFLDDPQFGWTRGVLADLGSHTIDLALYLVGAQSFAIRDREILRDGDIDRKVRAAIELRPESSHRPNVTMDYCVSWLDRQPNRIELVFERCSVWAHCSPGARVFVGNPALPDEAVALSLPESVIAAATYNQAFYLEWLAFLKGLYNETESAISARSSILTTALVEQLARVAS